MVETRTKCQKKILFFCIYFLEDKLGSSLRPVLRAENWSWAGLGQWHWADFFSTFSSKGFLTLFFSNTNLDSSQISSW